MDVYKLIHIFKQFIILHTHLHIADWSTKYNKVQIVSANNNNTTIWNYFLPRYAANNVQYKENGGPDIMSLYVTEQN